ncbi:transcobalamin-2 isoform X2 [Protopterus annectens]|nr:transcobalamin-2 isoform X2 [Protopterus annectens]XP_043924387.1 transcobalamin-2 isoform X2 [Protopterus annectens]XP_043924388.1 transcobalamin-2 isoform X2 [Protopterus annectens]XP_043924389.1 transcobalamin-2 isoform X2 [Protopterus annectens]
METRLLVLLVCLQVFCTAGNVCDFKEKQHLIQTLTRKLLKATQDDSVPNPSIHIGLRLAKYHNHEMENSYLQRLRKERESDFLARTGPEYQKEPVTGLLALHILALQASCENLDNQTGKQLITQLKRALHSEKEHIATYDKPLSNYYQYSMGILALCINGKKIDHHVIGRLIQAEKRKKFMHHDSQSVDTEAMAGLALQCLEQSDFMYTDQLRTDINNTIKSLKKKIIESRSAEGIIGNIFSTPLAVQALHAMGQEDACSGSAEALLGQAEVGTFHNPMALSLLIPVLHQKTYQDIANIDCSDEDNTLTTSHSGLNQLGNEIKVTFMVQNIGSTNNEYEDTVFVPQGSSLLEVLKTAHKEKPKHFAYEIKDSLWGPFLSSVNGITADVERRTYWQILKDRNIHLMEGIADYKPHDGDHIILRLSTW